MTHQRIMNRKGVTPVIAVVLLMAISVAATGTAYTFITNAQHNVAEGFEEKWGQQQLDQKSDLNIEHIYKSSNNYAFLVIRNTGSVPQLIQGEDSNGNTVKYWNLFIDGPPATDWSYTGSTPSSPVTLSATDTITINSTKPFPSSGQKEFKLIGRYGSEDSYICYSTGSSSC